MSSVVLSKSKLYIILVRIEKIIQSYKYLLYYCVWSNKLYLSTLLLERWT